MSSTIITMLRCDRCGHEAEMRGQADLAGWSMIQASDPHCDRPRAIGASAPDDLCPGCTDLLFAWWESREAVVQPVALPATTIRRFTIEDRAEAIELAGELLRMQAEQALEAAREGPTALLDGTTVPGSLDGIHDRAVALVDVLIAQLEDRAIGDAPPVRARPIARSLTLAPLTSTSPEGTAA